MSRTFTTTLKTKYLPNLIARDGGFNCLACRNDLKKVPWKYEFLDDDPSHVNFENIALYCISCSEEKKNNIDMKFLALEKKTKNEEGMFVCEREKVEVPAPLHLF